MGNYTIENGSNNFFSEKHLMTSIEKNLREEKVDGGKILG